MRQIGEVREYLEGAISSFEDDPPDDDYQMGFLAALQNLLAEISEDDDESA